MSSEHVAQTVGFRINCQVRKPTGNRSDLRNAEMVQIIEDIDVSSLRNRIKLEQSGEKHCLTVCQRGRQSRTALWLMLLSGGMLPGGGISE